ncbi:hypothetical protein H0H81_006923 [Sphagnurus paluster]|uniref:Glucose-methanol-choline oxidoreductase N-terminal domain-containing protein n=1 Tax=Sphagnurus paluster TaxID=117069 RepID=A0A9P7FT26_9AGAR|nr:hypothetical protein H0H81_006923 [Sphagnurus paluster]
MFAKISLTLALSGIASSKLINLKTEGANGKSALSTTEFDFSNGFRSFLQIVIGGGTAGLTVAHRLSDDSSKKVLVLEAGRSGINEYAHLRFIQGQALD